MNKLKICWFIILLVIVIGVVFVTKRPQTANTPIKIGVATILTGDFAALGENIVKTAELTVKNINAAGGVNGRNIELVVEDSGVDSKSGLSAAQKLINVDGVKYIVGGMSSNGTLAATPLANQNHVIIMTPVTGGNNVDEAGEYIFRTANSDVLAGRDIANAMLKKGYKNVGVVSEVTEYTLDIKNTFEKTIQDGGGNVVVSEEFQPNAKDFRTMIVKAKDQKPEAILVLSQVGTDAAYFIKQSKELGLSVPIYTDFTLAANTSVKDVLGSFNGIHFADPAYDKTDPSTLAFFDEFQKTYGKPPFIAFHSAATYDAIMLMVQGIKAKGDNSVKVKEWLVSDVKKYKGLMGTYSLDANGNSDLGFNMKVYKGEEIVSDN